MLPNGTRSRANHRAPYPVPLRLDLVELIRGQPARVRDPLLADLVRRDVRDVAKPLAAQASAIKSGECVPRDGYDPILRMSFGAGRSAPAGNAFGAAGGFTSDAVCFGSATMVVGSVANTV